MTLTVQPPPPLAPIRWPHRVYPGALARTSQVRADLRADLHSFPDDLIETVILCASELFANAVEHTASGDGGEVLRAMDQPTPATLRVTIVDDGHCVNRPAIPDRDADDWLLAERQRGLLLIDALSHSFGSYSIIPGRPHLGRGIWATFTKP